MKNHPKKDYHYLQYIWFVSANAADPKEYYKYDDDDDDHDDDDDYIDSIIYNDYFKYCKTRHIVITVDDYSSKGNHNDDFIDCARNNDYQKLFCIHSQETIKGQKTKKYDSKNNERTENKEIW